MRQVVVEVQRIAGLVASNVTPEISTGHGPLRLSGGLPMVRHAEKRPLNLVPCAQQAEVVQLLDLVRVAVQGHGGEDCAPGAPRHPRGFIDGTSVVRGHSGPSECLSIRGNAVHVILDVRAASAASRDDDDGLGHLAV